MHSIDNCISLNKTDIVKKIQRIEFGLNPGYAIE